jgi:hypothetical protein
MALDALHRHEQRLRDPRVALPRCCQLHDPPLTGRERIADAPAGHADTGGSQVLARPRSERTGGTLLGALESLPQVLAALASPTGTPQRSSEVVRG